MVRTCGHPFPPHTPIEAAAGVGLPLEPCGDGLNQPDPSNGTGYDLEAYRAAHRAS